MKLVFVSITLTSFDLLNDVKLIHFFLLFLDIADVTHFVKPNTPLDDEAASRGTTVYLMNKRIDMLPGLLGTSK